MFQTLKSDLQAVLKRDPAAKSIWEVMLCYPGFRAVRIHRRANWYYRHKMHLLARMTSEWCRFTTGIDIHPGATIGARLFIDHGVGVVIGETAIIGDDVTIFQGATLGGTGKDSGKRHPTVGDHVTISAGAKVLGPVHGWQPRKDWRGRGGAQRCAGVFHGGRCAGACGSPVWMQGSVRSRGYVRRTETVLAARRTNACAGRKGFPARRGLISTRPTCRIP